MTRLQQQDLIDKTPLNLWSTPALAPKPAQTPMPAPKPTNCLKCGKPSATMFCNSRCKRSWQSGMNNWHAKLARTKLVGDEEVTLF